MGEHLPLVRNAGGKNVVKSRDAIGGDEEEMLVESINVSDLAARMQGKAVYLGI